MVAESELMGAASSIEAAAVKLAELRPRVQPVRYAELFQSVLCFLFSSFVAAHRCRCPTSPPAPSVCPIESTTVVYSSSDVFRGRLLLLCWPL